MINSLLTGIYFFTLVCICRFFCPFFAATKIYKTKI